MCPHLICFPGADVLDLVEFESGLTDKTRGKLPVASLAKKQKLNLVRPLALMLSLARMSATC